MRAHTLHFAAIYRGRGWCWCWELLYRSLSALNNEAALDRSSSMFQWQENLREHWASSRAPVVAVAAVVGAFRELRIWWWQRERTLGQSAIAIQVLRIWTRPPPPSVQIAEILSTETYFDPCFPSTAASKSTDQPPKFLREGIQ